MRLKYLLVMVIALSFFGCKNGPDVSDVKVDFEVIPFYLDLHSVPADSVAEYIPILKKKYGNFLNAYSEGVIHIGSINAPEYPEYLKSFIEYGPNRDVFDTCKIVYKDTRQLKSNIEQAFKHYRYYFKNAEIPNVYLQISGFNQSMVVDSGIVAVSIEKYLGTNCKFYQWLSYPIYLRKKMEPEKIVPDIMKAIAMTEFPFNDSIDDVIGHMVYEGKVAWFVKQMVPDVPDTLLFDYSAKEMKWCEDNESQMWATVVENKHLFNNDRMVIQKYTGDAPFTSFFGQDSPGHAGIYLGYRMVETYMNHNKEMTIGDLMKQDDAHLVLSKSGYRP